jgi:hypothetical protein
MSKEVEALRTKLDIERRTVAARRKTRENARTASFRLLRQLSARGQVQGAQKAFENLAAAELGLSAAEAYNDHVQNLWNNAAQLLSKSPISSDLQTSIDYCYALAAINPQKDMEAVLRTFAKYHKCQISCAADRAASFYVSERTVPTAAEAVPIIVRCFEHQQWSPDWITSVFASNPAYRDAWQQAMAPPPPHPPFGGPRKPGGQSPIEVEPQFAPPRQSGGQSPFDVQPQYGGPPQFNGTPSIGPLTGAAPPGGPPHVEDAPYYPPPPGDITDLPDYPSLDPALWDSVQPGAGSPPQ